MKLHAAPIALLAAFAFHADAAAVPYKCSTNKVAYPAAVKLQAQIMSDFSPSRSNIPTSCSGSFVSAGTGWSTAFGCVYVESSASQKKLITAGQVQSAFGQLLSGCTGFGGTILLDGVVYALF